MMNQGEERKGARIEYLAYRGKSARREERRNAERRLRKAKYPDAWANGAQKETQITLFFLPAQAAAGKALLEFSRVSWTIRESHSPL
jgi:hypothetical protein